MHELARWRYSTVHYGTVCCSETLAGRWSGIPEFRIVGLAEVPSLGDPREEPRRAIASGLSCCVLSRHLDQRGNQLYALSCATREARCVRLVFSRKGFDSVAGKAPTPIIDGKPTNLRPAPAASARPMMPILANKRQIGRLLLRGSTNGLACLVSPSGMRIRSSEKPFGVSPNRFGRSQ